MSINRQQRQSSNRRIVSIAAPQLVPQLSLTVVGTAGPTLELSARVYSQPPDDASLPLEMQLVGIPQILRVSTDAYPTGAALSSDGLMLSVTYAGGILSSGETFRVGPYDPAVRTAQGGWVAPGLIAIEAADAFLLPYTAILSLDGTVRLTGLSAALPTPTVFWPRGFAVVETGALNRSIAWDGIGYVLTFDGPPLAGQTLQYTGPLIVGNGDTMSQPDQLTHEL